MDARENNTKTGLVGTHLSHDLPRVRETLLQHNGNISRAAQTLGITKPYAMWLVRHFELNEWARALRQERGLPSTGRPPRAAAPQSSTT